MPCPATAAARNYLAMVHIACVRVRARFGAAA